MEFAFDCEHILGCDRDGFALLEGTYQDAIKPAYLFYVHEILNNIGQESSRVNLKLNFLVKRSKNSHYISI